MTQHFAFYPTAPAAKHCAAARKPAQTRCDALPRASVGLCERLCAAASASRARTLYIRRRPVGLCAACRPVGGGGPALRRPADRIENKTSACQQIDVFCACDKRAASHADSKLAHAAPTFHNQIIHNNEKLDNECRRYPASRSASRKK